MSFAEGDAKILLPTARPLDHFTFPVLGSPKLEASTVGTGV